MEENKFNLKEHYFTDEEIAEMMSPELAKKKEEERQHKTEPAVKGACHVGPRYME